MAEINIYNCDCMEFMKSLPDKAYNLCVTDPPYGINLKYNIYQDTEENWFHLMDRFIPEVKRVCKMVIFPSCQIKRLPWFYKHHEPDWLVCWHKGSTGHVSYVGFNDWEPLIVYGKVKPQLYMHDFLSINNIEKMGNYNHPCPKPVSWVKKILKSVFQESRGKILDTFGGSGTSAIACYDMDFDLDVCELDTDYYNAAVERFERHKRQGVLQFD